MYPHPKTTHKDSPQSPPPQDNTCVCVCLHGSRVQRRCTDHNKVTRPRQRTDVPFKTKAGDSHNLQREKSRRAQAGEETVTTYARRCPLQDSRVRASPKNIRIHTCTSVYMRATLSEYPLGETHSNTWTQPQLQTSITTQRGPSSKFPLCTHTATIYDTTFDNTNMIYK